MNSLQDCVWDGWLNANHCPKLTNNYLLAFRRRGIVFVCAPDDEQRHSTITTFLENWIKFFLGCCGFIHDWKKIENWQNQI